MIMEETGKNRSNHPARNACWIGFLFSAFNVGCALRNKMAGGTHALPGFCIIRLCICSAKYIKNSFWEEGQGPEDPALPRLASIMSFAELKA